MSRARHRFRGFIAGMGTTSGVRIVLGHWPVSPFGAFSDVMLERPDGRRILFAPTLDVSRYVSQTYSFDQTEVRPVTVHVDGAQWSVAAGPLRFCFQVGSRMPLGHLLRMVPRRVATSPRWAAAVDPVAGLLLPGVRTTGTAGQGRREWYGATDLHRLAELTGSLDGEPLGALRPVDPPPHFGFSSTPRTPSLTAVVSTVELDAP